MSVRERIFVSFIVSSQWKPWIHLTRNECYCVFVWYFLHPFFSLSLSNIHNDVQTRVFLFMYGIFLGTTNMSLGFMCWTWYQNITIDDVCRIVFSTKKPITFWKRVNWPLFYLFHPFFRVSLSFFFLRKYATYHRFIRFIYFIHDYCTLQILTHNAAIAHIIGYKLMPISIDSKLSWENGITYSIIYMEFELVIHFPQQSSQENHLLWEWVWFV